MTAATSATFPATDGRAARLRPSEWLRVALLAAIAAAVVALAFDLAVAERTVDRAVALEGHGHGAAAVPELFSRGEQRGGLAVGLLLHGAGVAFLLAGAAVLLARRTGLPRRLLWLVLAGGAAWSVAFLPALAYPPLPPGVESELGIGARQGLYLAVVATGLAGYGLAAWALRSARGTPAGLALAAAALGGAVAVSLLLLPEQRALGALPADVLRDFRLASAAAQALFWVALGGAGYVLLRRREPA
jgi:hypothetical protein